MRLNKYSHSKHDIASLVRHGAQVIDPRLVDDSIISFNGAIILYC